MSSNNSGPGKSHRAGITMMQLNDMFPDEASARKWVEDQVWSDGRVCGHCGSANTHEAKHPSMPYRCRDCRKCFSVKTGTAFAASNISLRKWVFAVYIELTNLKGVSSMKLHRDLGVTQKTAWFMQHRIRESFIGCGAEPYAGPVEVDETFVGGKVKNMAPAKRAKHRGRGTVGKTAVAGVKDRVTGQVTTRVVAATDAATLLPFVENTTVIGATVFSDGAKAYQNINRPHHSVDHGVGEYVRGMAHVNGIESFWSMLKRGYHGVYHHLSPKHLHRYANQYAGRHNFRNLDTIEQMSLTIRGLVGQRLRYEDLIADTELSNAPS